MEDMEVQDPILIRENINDLIGLSFELEDEELKCYPLQINDDDLDD
ncbi:MAG: hypothetical protein E7J94_02110 [Clostridium sp.]|nr:hypothetical protein [Clostridium sp.]